MPYRPTARNAKFKFSWHKWNDIKFHYWCLYCLSHELYEKLTHHKTDNCTVFCLKVLIVAPGRFVTNPCGFDERKFACKWDVFLLLALLNFNDTLAHVLWTQKHAAINMKTNNRFSQSQLFSLFLANRIEIIMNNLTVSSLFCPITSQT